MNRQVHVRVLLALAALSVPFVPVSAAAGDLNAALSSVVSVLPQWQGRPPNADEPEGSGVAVLTGRFVLTANHVLGNAKTILIRTRDGDIMTASIKGRDKLTDLALLEIGKEVPAAAFAGEAQLGSKVCAAGNAFGLGIAVTCGWVSAVNRSGTGFNAIEDFVQTDAAVNPGASGGALFDGEGKLVGVLSAIFTKKSDANIGINFAVSAQLARKVADELAANGKVNWAFAGAGLRAYPRRGETGRQALEVMHVRPSSAAEAAGLLPGDRIIAAGQWRMRKPPEFRAAFARLSSGETLQLTIERNGRPMAIAIRHP